MALPTSPAFFTERIVREDSIKFCTSIEALIAEHRMGYMDAIIHLCEKTSIEPEMAATLLNPVIREYVRQEATSLNMIRKTVSLPF